MEVKGCDRAGGTAATLYIAIELSRSGWLAAVLKPGAQRPSRHKLKAGAVDQLLALIAATRGTRDGCAGATRPATKAFGCIAG